MVETMSRSVLTKDQKKTFRKDFLDDSGRPAAIIVEIRYDDECGNGHNTFSITGEIYNRNYIQGEETITSTIKSGGKSSLLWLNSCGCIHDDIVKHFPEFSNLIKFHLCSSDGPLHYLANTLYFVDEHGPTHAWIYYNGQHDPLGIDDKEERLLGYKNKETALKCENQPGYRVEWDEKTTKKRELDSAGHSAIWPEATDEELTAPDLKQKLIERLPALMKEFREMVESLGFTY